MSSGLEISCNSECAVTGRVVDPLADRVGHHSWGGAGTKEARYLFTARYSCNSYRRLMWNPGIRKGGPEAADREVHGYGVGAVRVRKSTIELRGDPGHGNQRNGSGNDIDLQITQPCEILQIGVTYKVNRHQSNNHLVHNSLRHYLLLRWL